MAQTWIRFSAALACSALAGCLLNSQGSTAQTPGATTSTPAVGGNAPYVWRNIPIGGGGAIPGILLHPKVRDLAYIRTDVGGAYRWDNANTRWTPMFDWIPFDEPNLAGTASLAIDPSEASGNTLYAAAGTYGANWLLPERGVIMKSTDRGNTWTRTSLSTLIGSNWDQTSGERLMVDPANGQRVYFASRGEGLFRTTDGAKTWNKVLSAPLGDISSSEKRSKGTAGLLWILIDPKGGTLPNPTRSKVLYISAFKDGVYRSDDGGEKWQKLDGSPTESNRAAIASDGTLYATHNKGIARWNGTVWSDITPTEEKGKSFLAVGVDPRNPSHLLTTRHWWGFHNTVFRSTDGGINWNKVDMNNHVHSVSWRDKNHVASSIFDIRFDPLVPNRVWYTDWYATWRTNDITAAQPVWNDLVRGHEEIVTTGTMTSPPSGEVKVFMGAADVDGFDFVSLTEPPTQSLKHKGWTGGFHATGVDFSEANPQFAVRVATKLWHQPGGGGYSTNGGRTWTMFSGLPDNPKGGRIAVSATSEKMVWATQDGDVFYSGDRGATWRKANGAPDKTVFGNGAFASVDPLSSDRVAPDTFYLFKQGQFYRSRDGGANWTQTSAQLPNTQWDGVVLRAAPGMANEVWLSAEGRGLFRSSDGGDSFQKVETVQRAHAIAWGKAAPGKTNPALFVYGRVNNTQGIFRSDDMAKSWTRIDVPATAITQPKAMAGDRQVFGRVYIGSGGRGIYYGEPAR